MVKAGLCTGCGVCAGVCPTEAIVMGRSRDGFWRPILITSKCTKCGVCLKVCSSYQCELSKTGLARGENLPLGRVLDVFIAWSANKEVRSVGSSGGVVSQLIISSLKEGLIDGAIVCLPDPDDPFYARMILAHNRDEMLSAARSKYSPSTMDKALQKLRKVAEVQRCIIVGLPCQIASIRCAMKAVPLLSGKILCCIGLFCGRIVSAHLGRLQAELGGVDPDAVVRFASRVGDWHGFNILIQTVQTEFDSLSIPFRQSAFGLALNSRFLTQDSCLLCTFTLAPFADIAVGDAWLPRFSNEREGRALVLIRSDRGKGLFERVLARADLHTLPSNVADVFQAQPHAKWIYASARAQAALRRIIGLPVSEGLKEEAESVGLGKLVGAGWHALSNKAILNAYVQRMFPPRLIPPVIKLANKIKTKLGAY